MMDSRIEQFLLALPDEKRSISLKVRDLFLDADPRVSEAIKWNQLTFSCKGNLAFIYTYPGVEYMNLGFMQALSLSDPNRLFEGSGKAMRHIKIHTVRDIPVAQVRKWIRESIEVDESIARAKGSSSAKKAVKKAAAPAKRKTVSTGKPESTSKTTARKKATKKKV